MNPRPLLHLEGAAVLIASLFAYQQPLQLTSFRFAASGAGYLNDRYVVNTRVGAITYDAIHTYVGPLVLGAFALFTGKHLPLLLALVWIGHSGFDRMLGFGLKYPSRLKDTHLDPERHTVGSFN